MLSRTVNFLSFYRVLTFALLVWLFGYLSLMFSQPLGAHDPKDRGNYIYMEMSPMISTMSVTQGVDGRPIMFGHLISETSEASELDATDFHFYRIPESPWVQFAVPVDRQEDQLQWTFEECKYQVVEAYRHPMPVYSKAKHKDNYITIHGDCGAPEMNLLFLYGNVRGLVAWSTGNFIEMNGRKVFDPFSVYVLIGEYGFGSRWPEH